MGRCPTGCTVEEIQLETTHRPRNCLAFYKIIACRILHLTHLNWECPVLPCDVVLDDGEWQPVWRIVKKEPTPGPKVISSELRRMLDFAMAWQAFQQYQSKIGSGLGQACFAKSLRRQSAMRARHTLPKPQARHRAEHRGLSTPPRPSG
ncbi:MAG: hypothetical protein C0478_05735 [Planctomyces sp.]|nr:hypothetical protein [Planctomyces sp.]